MIQLLVISMLLLSLEKMTYMYVFHNGKKFQRFCKTYLSRSPMSILGYLLTFFKIIQISVFVNWWYVTGSLNFSLHPLQLIPFIIGAILFIGGQFLNFSVFYKLGKESMLYGKQFGYELPWVTTFPFSVFKHPQYVGTLVSIWGCFIALNFSYEYWYAIPALETILYILGTEQEQESHVA